MMITSKTAVASSIVEQSITLAIHFGEITELNIVVNLVSSLLAKTILQS